MRAHSCSVEWRCPATQEDRRATSSPGAVTAQFLGSGTMGMAAETWPSFALTQMAPASTSVPWLGDTQPGQDLVVDSSQQAQGAYPSDPRLHNPETEFQKLEFESETMPMCGWLDPPG